MTDPAALGAALDRLLALRIRLGCDQFGRMTASNDLT